MRKYFKEGDQVKRLFAILGAVALLLTTLVSAEDKPTFKVKGDFRYRHEMIEKQDTKTRTRHRLRARVNIEGKVNDEAKIVVGISSGSDDPVSNNQSLDDGFSSKDVVLDIAYFEYKFKKAPGLSLLGGKVYNPFFKPGKSELIWDSDIRFEGMVGQYNHTMDDLSVRLTGAGFWVEERKDNTNSSLLAGQGVLRYEIPDQNASVTIGGGFYLYEYIKGYAPFAGDGAGNSLAPDTTYANDYDLFEILGEVNMKAGKTPLTLMGNYVKNTTADSLNDGWLVGVRVGKLKKVWSWDLKYNYREINKDAVVGTYTDSDFIGGGTDGKGHEFGAGMQLAEKTSLGVTYFINEIGMDNGRDFNRLQVDAKFKF